jgi:hypothetical protein
MLVLFGATAGILSIQHRDFYFERPVESWGDFAANHLAIRNAGKGQEIHGNYSRWRFNHPGPVIFYVEAAGERLFHKWMPICPRPHNAHALAGMLLQAFFWSLTLAVIAVYLPTLGHLAAIWTATWVHFALTGHAFTSIWPPHTLLMPFVCFVLSCVSVACGRLSHLWIVALAGMTLIHNHVAQPLPVAMLGIWLVVMMIVRRNRLVAFQPTSARAHKYWLLLNVTIVSFLAAPLIIDLFAGSQSNLHAILDHLSRQHDGKTLGQSIHFFFKFGTYWEFNDILPPWTSGERRNLLLPLTVWCGVVTVASFQLLSSTRRKSQEVYHLFLRLSIVAGGVMLIAAFVWGVRINGPLYSFNGFYFYGIYAVPLIVGACVAYDFCVVTHRWRLELLLVAASIIPWISPRHFIVSDVSVGTELRKKLTEYTTTGRINLAHPILLLSGANVGLETASVANLLEELGAKIEVTPTWEFLFGSRFRVVVNRTQPQIWAVTSASIAGSDGLDLPGCVGSKLVNVNKSWSGGHPFETQFASDFLPLMAGFSADAGNPPWSIGPEGDIVFPSGRVNGDVEITFDLKALAGPKNSNPRRLRVQTPNQPPLEFAVSGSRSFTWTISENEWNAAVSTFGFVLFHFDFLDPISPAQCGINDDDRPLSLSFEKLGIRVLK